MNDDKALTDVLEIVQFLKDNAVSREDLEAMATKKDLEGMATKKDLAGLEYRFDLKIDSIRVEMSTMKSDIMTQVDSFIKLHQKLDQELTALRGKYDRLEELLQKMAKHLQLDLNKL